MSLHRYGDGLFADFYNANDPAAASAPVAERLADDFVDHAPSFGASPDKAGLAGTAGFINGASRQDYRVERTVEQGDTVVAIWNAEVTHAGQFLHVAPTGRGFRLNGIAAYMLRDGRIAAHWERFDVLPILVTLGVIPRLGG